MCYHRRWTSTSSWVSLLKMFKMLKVKTADVFHLKLRVLFINLKENIDFASYSQVSGHFCFFLFSTCCFWGRRSLRSLFSVKFHCWCDHHRNQIQYTGLIAQCFNSFFEHTLIYTSNAIYFRKTVSPVPKDHRLKNKILIKLGERLVKMFHLKAGSLAFCVVLK